MDNEKLREVIAFLHGEAPLEGVWFGASHPKREGAYWWRIPLREAFATRPTAKEAAPGGVGDGRAVDVIAYGPVDGVGERHPEGSYIMLHVSKGNAHDLIRISKGAADILADEIRGIVPALAATPSPPAPSDSVDLCEVAAAIEVVRAREAIYSAAAVVENFAEPFRSGFLSGCEEIAYRLEIPFPPYEDNGVRPKPEVGPLIAKRIADKMRRGADALDPPAQGGTFTADELSRGLTASVRTVRYQAGRIAELEAALAECKCSAASAEGGVSP